MRVVVATARAPFSAPSQLAADLQAALEAAGHAADLAALPFPPATAARIPDQMLAARLMQLTESSGVAIDRLIALAFPATLIPHPAKCLWLTDLYAPAYAAWQGGSLSAAPGGAHIRAAIHTADAAALAESAGVYTVSRRVSLALQAAQSVVAPPLHPPPPKAGQFSCAEAGDMVLVPDDRLTDAAHGPVLDAMAAAHAPVRACFTGRFASLADEQALRRRAAPLATRVDWRPGAPNRPALFAQCLAVISPDAEGALEAMLASKPVLAADASELVVNGCTGFTADLAGSLDRLWADRPRAAAMGRAGRAHYDDLRIGWPHVLACLLS